MKKVVLCALVFVLVTAGVWAGGQQDSVEAEPETVTLRIWEHSPQFEAPLKAVVNGFMEKNPNIKVQYEIKTPDNYLSLLTTSIQAGEAPDLFWHHGNLNTDMVNLYKQDALMDLSNHLSGDVKNYSEMSLSVVKHDGKLLQTPGASIDTRAVFYNKGLFEEKGWAVPKNFGEFEALLPKIKQAGYIPISLGGRFSWNILFLFEPILAAMHPDWIQEAKEGEARIDDPRVIDAMNKMLEWGEKGYYGDMYLGVDEAGQYLAFAKEEAAMTVAGSWTADTLSKNNPSMNIGAFQMPTADGRKPIVLTYAPGFSVYKETEHPDAAVKLAKYLVTKEAQRMWIKELGAISGLDGVESGSRLANEIADANLECESFYNILVMYGAEGKSPTKVWEEDNTLLLSGEIQPEEFVETLDSMMDYPGL